MNQSYLEFPGSMNIFIHASPLKFRLIDAFIIQPSHLIMDGKCQFHHYIIPFLEIPFGKIL